ncbi:MAG TPA: ATP synthase subunit I [Candidatus Xenobia bacterium]|nr:ATP synthase subunit I [Candidatus Xenobia bacterium]
MSQAPPAGREFVEKAVRRIGWIILGLVPVGAAIAAARWGWPMALAFAVGGLLAYANYRWIVAVVDAMLGAQKAKPSPRIYARLLLPIVLLVAALYAIVSRSLLPLPGFFAGLFLLAAGVLLEGLYEIALGQRSKA